LSNGNTLRLTKRCLFGQKEHEGLGQQYNELAGSEEGED